jgi:hypothetical protein
MITTSKAAFMVASKWCVGRAPQALSVSADALITAV